MGLALARYGFKSCLQEYQPLSLLNLCGVGPSPYEPVNSNSNLIGGAIFAWGAKRLENCLVDASQYQRVREGSDNGTWRSTGGLKTRS